MYFQLLWFIGAAQTDAANLSDANIDWQSRVLRYERQKLNGRSLPPACLVIGKGLEVILRQLPGTGPLFPTITKMDDRSRACYMWKLCKRVGITGVSLHSYRALHNKPIIGNALSSFDKTREKQIGNIRISRLLRNLSSTFHHFVTTITTPQF